MNERLIFEDTTQKAYYWWEDGALVVRLTNKNSGAYCENIYDSRQAHKAAKKWEN